MGRGAPFARGHRRGRPRDRGVRRPRSARAELWRTEDGAWTRLSYDDSLWREIVDPPVSYGYEDAAAETRAFIANLIQAELEIVDLEPEVVPRKTWRFDSAELAQRHGLLARIVRSARALRDDRGLNPWSRVKARRKDCERNRRVSIDDADTLWRNAIRAIARDDSPYGGLEIQQQEGLVPVGEDPGSGLQEFAHALSGDTPKRDSKGRLVLTDDTAIILVLLPGGAARIGNAAPPELDPKSGLGDEKPEHSASLDPFFLSEYEMTQAQWSRLFGTTPSLLKAGKHVGRVMVTSRHPVESISYQETQDGLRRFSLEIPTEVQWEYACRAGTTSSWWCGDDLKSLPGLANFADIRLLEYDEREDAQESLDDGFPVHAPIGSLRPNRFGLHEFTGNVSEWVRDWYISYDDDLVSREGARTGPAGEKDLRLTAR